MGYFDKIKSRSCPEIKGISDFVLERIAGIEPALLAWEAKVLPLNYIRNCIPYYATKIDKSQVKIRNQMKFFLKFLSNGG